MAKNLILSDLNKFEERSPDLIIEVAHPQVSIEYGCKFLSVANYMVGSPSVLVNSEFETQLVNSSKVSGRTIFVPSGALWGGHDIRRMSDCGILHGLNITMTFNPNSLKSLEEPLRTINYMTKAGTEARVLFEGSARELCPLAPNNTNTVATAAIAASSLGFDGTWATLISDPSLTDFHKIEMKVIGPEVGGRKFEATSCRMSPASKGHVTSSVTFVSFYNSVLEAKCCKGWGLVLC